VTYIALTSLPPRAFFKPKPSPVLAVCRTAGLQIASVHNPPNGFTSALSSTGSVYVKRLGMFNFLFIADRPFLLHRAANLRPNHRGMPCVELRGPAQLASRCVLFP
jgi:hypothetical protein